MDAEIFPGFLGSPSKYDEVMRFWDERWAKLLTRTFRSKFWKSPWLGGGPTTLPPDRDGNPIFTAVCPSKALGVRIVQYEREAPDDLAFDWWIDYAGGSPGELGTIRELVISCILTQWSLSKIEEYLKMWVSKGQIEETDFDLYGSDPYPIDSSRAVYALQ